MEKSKNVIEDSKWSFITSLGCIGFVLERHNKEYPCDSDSVVIIYHTESDHIATHVNCAKCKTHIGGYGMDIASKENNV